MLLSYYFHIIHLFSFKLQVCDYSTSVLFCSVNNRICLNSSIVPCRQFTSMCR